SAHPDLAHHPVGAAAAVADHQVEEGAASGRDGIVVLTGGRGPEDGLPRRLGNLESPARGEPREAPLLLVLADRATVDAVARVALPLGAMQGLAFVVERGGGRPRKETHCLAAGEGGDV